MKLDAARIRADFPIFEQRFHGKPLAYLDSANTSQKPRQVLEAITEFYSTSYANVHRSVYELAERATEAFEGARGTVAAFVNAPSREIVFVRNATEEPRRERGDRRIEEQEGLGAGRADDGKPRPF